jgi:hypothetical protein
MLLLLGLALLIAVGVAMTWSERPARKTRGAVESLKRRLKPIIDIVPNVAFGTQSQLQVMVSWSRLLALAIVLLAAISVGADPPSDKDDFKLKGTWVRQEPIINPPVESAEEGSRILAPSELVLGIQVGKQARAYPLKVLYGRLNEVINDTLGGQPILATY